MKKLLLLILLLIPIRVNAEIKVENHLIDAEIEIAGGLRVKELIVFKGNTKDFSRTINYKMINEEWDKKTINFKRSSIYNGYSLENIKVAVIEAPKELDYNSIPNNFNKYIEELDPKSKEKNFYTNIKNELGSTINIHHEGKEETTAIYLEYVVSNVIVVHEDVLELNYTFKNLNLGSNKTFIRVIIPYATTSKEYNFWLHGPSTGALQELITSSDEKMGIVSEFPKLKNDINIRMTLPKEQVGIDLYLNKTNTKALNQILKIENSKIKRQSTDDNIYTIIKYGLIVTSIIYILGSFLLIKYNIKSIFLLYLLLGFIITLFNLILKFNIIYIYFILLVPLTIKSITLLKNKTKK